MIHGETPPLEDAIGEIQNFYEFSACTLRQSSIPITITDAQPEFVDPTPELTCIYKSGPVLAEGLASPVPEEQHNALQSLIRLELLSKAMPSDSELSQPSQYVCKYANESLDNILNANQPLAVDVLRFLCHTVTRSNGKQGGDLLRRHLYKIFTPTPGESPKISVRTQLAADLREAMAQPKHPLRKLFMQALSYGTTVKTPRHAWKEVGPKRLRHAWRKRNLQVMMALEGQEPGLCVKITDLFKIKNFAHFTPKMLAAMYHSRLDNPEQPTIIELKGSIDPNKALSTPKETERLFFKLRRAGRRYEIYECTSEADIEHASRQANELNTEHGAKVEALLIGMHGNHESLGLSRQHHVKGKGLRRFQDFKYALSQAARVLMASCSAGKLKNGKCIALSLQQLLDRPVNASTSDVAAHFAVNRRGEVGVRRSRIASKLGMLVLIGWNMTTLHASSNTILPILEDTPLRDYRMFAVMIGGAATGLASRSLALRVMGAYTSKVFSDPTGLSQNKNAPS